MSNDHIMSSVGAVIVKTTSRCNMKCDYCYENISAASENGDMPLSVFYQMIDEVNANSKMNRIVFILHGGEPTLMSEEWLDSAVGYAHLRAKETGKTFIFNLQSNFKSISTPKLKKIKQLELNCGVSVDGPGLANSLRGSQDSTIKNIKRASQLGLHISALLTINRSNYADMAYTLAWLDSELAIKVFKANISHSVGNGLLLPEISTEQVYFAQKAILDYFCETEGRGLLEINLLSEVYRYFSGRGKTTLCGEKRCGAGKYVIGVTPNGDILPCGRFDWNDKENRLGSLGALNDDWYIAKLNLFHNDHQDNFAKCEICDARKICSYGCQAFIARSSSKRNIECGPTILRLAYYRQNEGRLRLALDNAIARNILPFAYMNNSDYSDGPYNDYPDSSYPDRAYNDYSDCSSASKVN
ncbi:radical SAM protein [Thiocystis violascens]|uniref:Radical SAM additional 4Fe4S-binding domain protein n=1 Tax=Thiocystis violascens (strain ATCC 17096 / DSM 198 / 6111) TaxID=765911 RepID=I3Y8E7_THIV6|nr:SPASM domain-containing protein [Thiocystis violascens]AFL73265.1 radical SAM additional 4Fe4S-binding domain protein [Thiocystis violascens DSM 198]